MNPLRKALVGGALAATVLAGGAVGAALAGGTAGATTNPSTTASSSATAPPTQSGYGTPQGQAPGGQNGQAPQGQPPKGSFDPSKGGHQANGKTEKLLTGTTKAKAEAAAKAKVSGATVQRSETDAEGAAYEVHLQKSDGSLVTVKLDSSFAVTSVENGLA